MISLYALKPGFQKRLLPLCHLLQRCGAHPNQVTVATAILALIFGGGMAVFPDARWLLALLPLVLFIRMALNALDGMLAVASGLSSKRGAVLNEVGDVVADAALYLPLARFPGFPAPSIVICVAAIIACEWQGIAAVCADRRPRHDGPMGKSDRAFAFGLLSLLVWLDLISLTAVRVCVWGIAVLVVLTRIKRSRSG